MKKGSNGLKAGNPGFFYFVSGGQLNAFIYPEYLENP
jgi:hypothetical protein